jgi:hypothetical protein
VRCSLLTLSSYLDEELDAAQRADVDAHLLGCERCHNAVEYLREEVGRISGLARVRVSDDGARAFLEQLGLIGPDDELPPRPPRPRVSAADAPPWFAGSPGGTLPWMPRRDSEPGPDVPDQPSLPFTNQAAQERRPPPPAAPADARDAAVELNGRPTYPRDGDQGSPSAVLTLPQPRFSALGGAAVPAEGGDDPPRLAREVETEGVLTPGIPVGRGGLDPGVQAGLPDRAGETVSDPGGTPPGGEAAPGHPSARQPGPAHEPDGGPGSAAHLHWGPPAEPVAPPTPQPATSAGDDPWAWAPRDHPPTSSSLAPAAAPASPGPQPSAVAPARSHALPGPAASPGEEGADPLIDPLIARAAGPPARLRPSMMTRLRDQAALRLALMRSVDTMDVAQPARQAPGRAPAAPPAPAGPGGITAETWPEPGRGRADPGAEWQEGASPAPPPLGGPLRARPAAPAAAPPLRPSPEPAVPAAPLWLPPVPVPPAPHPGAGRSKPTTAEELPPAPQPLRPAPPPGTVPAGGDGSRRVPGRHSRALASRAPRWAASGVPSALRTRAAAVGAVLALLLVIVVVASRAGGPSPGAAVTHPPSAHPLSPASAAPVTQVTLSPGATATPSASPTATAAPSPSASAAPGTTYGGSGSGWQLDGVRCCGIRPAGDPDAGDTRVVFLLSGGSGGAPAVVVSFPDPTTMLISFSGTIVTGSIPQESGGIVSRMDPPSASQAIFRFTLTRKAAVRGWAFSPTGYEYSGYSPLIYFDLG